MTDQPPEWAVRLQRTADITRQQTLAALLRADDLMEAAMVTQQQIDAYAGAVAAYADRVTAATAAIRDDIAAIKAANPDVDTTSLEAHLDRLGGAATGLEQLDAENPPPAPPAEPTG